MKKLILLTLVLITANSAIAQNVFTKYVYSETEYLLEERSATGILIQTTLADHSFKTMKSYYPCGRIQAIGYSINNRRTGKWKFYSQTGSLTLLITYRNNRAVRYDKRIKPPTDLIAIR